MAFGKKKEDETGPAVDETPATEAEIDELPDDAPVAEAPVDEAAPVEASAPAEAPTAPDALGSDALLSMFQESKSEVDDLAVLTDLAGETDIDDILEELRTLRAALGISDAFEDDLAAAA